MKGSTFSRFAARAAAKTRALGRTKIDLYHLTQFKLRRGMTKWICSNKKGDLVMMSQMLPMYDRIRLFFSSRCLALISMLIYGADNLVPGQVISVVPIESNEKIANKLLLTPFSTTEQLDFPGTALVGIVSPDGEVLLLPNYVLEHSDEQDPRKIHRLIIRGEVLDKAYEIIIVTPAKHPDLNSQVIQPFTIEPTLKDLQGRGTLELIYAICDLLFNRIKKASKALDARLLDSRKISYEKYIVEIVPFLNPYWSFVATLFIPTGSTKLLLSQTSSAFPSSIVQTWDSSKLYFCSLQVFSTGTPQIVGTQSQFLSTPEPLGTCALFPIRSANEVIGVLLIGITKTNEHNFDRVQLRLLEIISAILGEIHHLESRRCEY